tara:strand:+ start:532 stop:1689 length:1158 start_codon:yes stop_codon:yes gene_type:complete
MTIPFTIRGHHMATTTAGGLIRTPCGIQALGIHEANMKAASGRDVAADTAARLRTPEMLAFLAWLKTALPRLSYQDALGVLKELGFVTACLERQVTAVHGAQSAAGAFRLFPELEPTLLDLGFRLGRLPRDDAETTWCLAPFFSFTGSAGERRFALSVRRIDRLMNEAADILNLLRYGHVPFADAADLLAAAADRIRECRSMMADLAKNPFPVDFQAMRDHLVRLTIGGCEFEAPNATYRDGWARVDAALGVYGDLWTTALQTRLDHMPMHQRDRIEIELTQPSVAHVMEHIFGSEVRDASIAELVLKKPEAERSLREVQTLAKEHGALLHGVHMGAIRKNLPDDDGPETGQPLHGRDQGVSGRSISETEALRDMRRDHWLTRLK